MQKEKVNIKKNDKVKVVAGKDKGKIGKVLSVNREKNRLVVENINMIKRHTRPNVSNRQGGIIEREAPIDRSNVMLMCGKCVTPVRIKMKELEDGRKVRMCGKCKELID
ncbi:50S ribosomal protein L24 [Desulfosudis oleivorans]|uniref:Large ribosomal subunit protein uL24 n=1 Tax=Desulfosudis oleivorans (strain DSM 6200 / JCM 39069 / Hxd3) TaxID=96561 RepID=RL24_DESOH|nr:50S ribosomal protein L24 [Desulfosudis oleivorans]A8ZV68.1 RecName: Full=Large ribosomal subunit protein uL24; AltName: Full=50S ribosomal protein L24 [Desulfosudis oleivorans Hxd3]ABW66529.1 ribosomal protein L24 [Desulfosudis oleivorans Hxd3]